MKNSLKIILRILARLTLWRFQAKIVAITGSVGKTSTKEAVAAVLSSKFRVRAASNNNNNEIGVPLTIIGEETGNKNVFLWVWIIVKSLVKLFSGDYPKVLVLEMGTDRPGDIAYLSDLVGGIDIAILTDIGISHLEFFAHPEALAKEKLSLIKKLPKTSTAILNFDNTKIVEGKNSTKAEVVGYGFNPQSNVVISDFQIIDAAGKTGANFKINHKGNTVPFFLPNALGKPAALAAAAGVAAGLYFDINLVHASQALKKFNPPPGRLRLIEGIKHTRIIDDTYNSAPDSVVAALQSLSILTAGRKLVAIGEMAELGVQSDSGHREIAGKIVESGTDLVFLVGERTKITKDELQKRKFAGRVSWFINADAARLPIQNALIENDTILVKGSQSMRMEKIVKEIMAKPLLAEKLLVRQTGKWRTKE